MVTMRTQALVLRSVDFGESDRVLHLLVPESGRLPVIAKGARRSVKRFSGTLDYFNYLAVQIDRRRSTVMARLDQATLIRTYSSLRSDPKRFALGCYLLELLDRLAPEGAGRAEARQLFELALASLEMIATWNADVRLRTLLELRLLDGLGLRPELRSCVRCGRAPETPEVDFHVAEGGPVCGACAAQLQGLIRVHLGTLRALEQGLRFAPEQLDRLALGGATLDEARRLIERFRRFHVGLALKSEPFLDSAL